MLQDLSSDPASTFDARFSGLQPVDLHLPAMYRLRWNAGFHGDAIWRQHYLADWSGVHLVVRRFAGDLLLKARKEGVPLFVRHADPFGISVAHCRYMTLLRPDEWQAIQWLGLSVGSLQGELVPGPEGRFDVQGLATPPPLGGVPLHLTPHVLHKTEVR